MFLRKRNHTTGVTLIELMVALALVSGVLAAAGTMLLQAYANEAAYREQNEAQQNARTALDLITDDLRGALKNPGLDNLYGWGPGGSTINNPLRFRVMGDDGSTQKVVRYWLVPDSNDPNKRNLLREVDTDYARTPGVNGVVVARNIVPRTQVNPGKGYFIGILGAITDINGARVTITTAKGTGSNQSEVTLFSLVMFRNQVL